MFRLLEATSPPSVHFLAKGLLLGYPHVIKDTIVNVITEEHIPKLYSVRALLAVKLLEYNS